MEVYQGNIPEEEKRNNNKRYPNNPDNTIFPRSELNDYLPFWEKLTFFLIGFIGFQMLAMIVQLVVEAIPNMIVIEDEKVTSLSTLGETLVNFVSYLLLVIIFLLFLFFDKRDTYKRYFRSYTHPKAYLFTLMGFALLYGGQSVFSLLYTNFAPDYGTNANQSGLETLAVAYPAMLFFMIVFFAPFCEELTYRIGLVDLIGHKYKLRWLGIVISAIIFGFIHFSFTTLFEYQIALNSGDVELIGTYRVELVKELLNLPVYIYSGLVLAFTYAISGEISSSTTTHLANNLLSFVAIMIAQNTATNDPSSISSSLVRLFSHPLL